jgi:Rad3-related DNA helicase
VGSLAPHLVLTLQERNLDLAAQARWVEQALTGAQALFLVLGSSFAESIDLLGGRVNRAMVVGPALPEVNPVQQARLHEAQRGGREAAFRQVYQIPGMQKVNQALGRLVRSPGQTARVLLHCRRFAEDGYSRLLAGEYRNFTTLNDDASVGHWLSQRPDSREPRPSS